MYAPIRKESKSPVLGREIPEAKELSPEPAQTFDKIVDFAIREKDKAYDFYTRVALKVKYPWTRKAFVEFAAEELRQRERLLRMKSEGQAPPLAEGTSDLELTDYVTAEVVLRSELDSREALLIAIKIAQGAKCLYLDLARKATDYAMQVLFRSMALEEAKHKLALETEYDERVFT
jgi:rubrerythrin